MPLDIALIGPWPPYRGGIAQFGTRLATALRQRGHMVHPVTFSRQYPDRLFPGSSQLEPNSEPLNVPAAPRLIDSVDPRSWFRTGTYVRDLAPDAVLFQHWMPFFAPAYGTIARRCGRGNAPPTRLALVHNTLPHERRPADAALSRFFFRSCDGLLALSETVRRDVARLAPTVPLRQAFHPVYDQFGPAAGREEARKALGLPQDASVLLFFGFVRHYKGLDVLIDALPAIRERQPGAVLIVAGEFYDDAERYLEQIRQLDLQDAVRLESRYIPAAEVPLFFGAANLVVQPYRSATQSGVAQVAFGAGVPVVTTNVGALAADVRHGEAGLVVPPEDPARLAEAVLRFFEEPGLADHLREGASGTQAVREWGGLCTEIESMITRTD